jgi:hypothetical protein
MPDNDREKALRRLFCFITNIKTIFLDKLKRLGQIFINVAKSCNRSRRPEGGFFVP